MIKKWLQLLHFQMEIKKTESAVMIERNERMRLEAAVTAATTTLFDVDER